MKNNSERLQLILDDLENGIKEKEVLLSDPSRCRYIYHESDDFNDEQKRVAKGLSEKKKVKIPLREVNESLCELIDQVPSLSKYITNTIKYINTIHNFKLDNFYLNNLLLVGEPGTGKTHSIKKLAKIIGIECHEINLSEAQDGFYLVGSQKGFSNSTPGRISERLSRSSTANPIFIIDELDKVDMYGADGRKGHLPALLRLLERSTADSFSDLSLDLKIDLSGATFIFTANTLETIPEPLLSRLDVVEVQKPEGEVLNDIFGMMIAQELHNIGGDTIDVVVDYDDQVHQSLKRYNLRDINRACRDLIVHKLSECERGANVVIMPSDIDDILGIPEVTKKAPIGFINSY